MSSDKEIRNIWYATERRAKSPTKLIVYDEIGCLKLRNGLIEFISSDINILIKQIIEIKLVRQRPNWIIYIVGFPISLFLSFYTWNLMFEIAFIYFFIGILIVAIIGLSIGLSTRWVRLKHLDETGEITFSYFADGDKKGWGGIFGGTKRLFSILLSFQQRQ